MIKRINFDHILIEMENNNALFSKSKRSGVIQDLILISLEINSFRKIP